MMFVENLRYLVTNIEKSNVYYMVIGAFVTLSFVFLLMVLISSRKPKIKIPPKDVQVDPMEVITSQEINEIAGDDVLTTQLDLARAYIEMNKKQLARSILDHVMKHGDMDQQYAARELMLGLEMAS